MTVVCDGWIEPKHPRRLLRRGDAHTGVSFGMCDACAMALSDAGMHTRFGDAADDADFGDALLRVYAACAGLSIGDRLTVLQIAWLAIADNARTEAQMSMGGFLEEQVRQLTQLRKLFALRRRRARLGNRAPIFRRQSGGYPASDGGTPGPGDGDMNYPLE